MKSAAAAIFLSFAAAAQVSSSFSLEGTVVDADTAQPIESVHLRLLPEWPAADRKATEALTSADGNFTAQLKTGQVYRLDARVPGYLPDQSQIPAQCSPCRITVRLHAEARFTGRVLAADTKEPLSRVLVEAIRVSGSFDIATSRTVASVLTTANGEFMLNQVSAGQYFFRFTPNTAAASLIIADPRDPPARQFLRQWWPGGDTARNATPFTVLSGTVLRLPDVWMSTAPRFQVSGTVQPATCRPDDAYTVAIAHGAEPFRSTMVRCGDQYAFPDLTPGRYQISLRQGEVTEREEVVVTDSNLLRNLPPTQSVR